MTGSGTTGSRKHAVAIVFSSHEKVKFTVPSIDSIQLSAFKNSIRVTAYTHSSAGGTLYCDAFNTLLVTDESSITRSALRTKGYAVPVLGSQDDAPLQANVTVMELVSASEYAVYCHVEDTAGNKASQDDLILTKSVVTTLCCRRVLFTQVSKYLTASTNLETVQFAYRIPFLPEDGLELTITPHLARNGGGYENINILPKSYTFSTRNKNLGKSRKFALSAPLSVPGWHLHVVLEYF